MMSPQAILTHSKWCHELSQA